jgi:membrane-bound lytic murein transglycosylase MltF
MPKEKSSVDSWLGRETAHKKKALENASRQFDKNDSLTVNTLEAIYGQESSFGTNRRTRGMAGAAGDFQQEKKTAQRIGLKVSKTNDQRFDIDLASNGTAKYLKALDNAFKTPTDLGLGFKTIPIDDSDEREKFSIASLNAGEGRIGQAQQEAQKAGKDPTEWDDVKDFLEAAGASKSKVKEIVDYVDKVMQHESEFSKKSTADKKQKDRAPSKDGKVESGEGHWITKDGKHILIKD